MAPGLAVVQALDGRWDFGPQVLRGALESAEFGTYPTREAATLEAEAPEDRSEWAYLQLQQERQEWEADAQAVAEYEGWYLDKLAMEADAEEIGAYQSY